MNGVQEVVDRDRAAAVKALKKTFDERVREIETGAELSFDAAVDVIEIAAHEKRKVEVSISLRDIGFAEPVSVCTGVIEMVDVSGDGMGRRAATVLSRDWHIGFDSDDRVELDAGTLVSTTASGNEIAIQFGHGEEVS